MKSLNQAIKVMLNSLDGIMHFESVYAHCDIPCGIYDPYRAQLAAHTVIRMITMIDEMALPKNVSSQETAEYAQKLARMIAVKEEHAEICKSEVRIIWGDYFKPEMAATYPEMHELTWKIMKSGSKAKQSLSLADANELLENVMKFSELFWKSKNIATKRVMSPFPTKKEIVVPAM